MESHSAGGCPSALLQKFKEFIWLEREFADVPEQNCGADHVTGMRLAERHRMRFTGLAEQHPHRTPAFAGHNWVAEGHIETRLHGSWLAFRARSTLTV